MLYVECVTTPERSVIGYVEVSTATRNAKFITRTEAYDEEIAMPWVCGLTSESIPWDYAFAYFKDSIKINDEWVIVTKWQNLQCLDCTWKNGSKDKPDFWPNDHQ
jgi:hypothetical protein